MIDMTLYRGKTIQTVKRVPTVDQVSSYICGNCRSYRTLIAKNRKSFSKSNLSSLKTNNVSLLNMII